MRNLIFVAVVIVISLGTLNAQSIQFGAKAGVNFASLVGDDAEDAETRTSFHIGGVAEFMVSDKLSFQPELLYSSQGATSKYNEGGVNIEERLKLDYLNVPLIGKFYVTEGFSIQAGPKIGLLLAANGEVEIDGVSVEEDVKEFLKDIDFGVNFGLGYKLLSGLFFDARYNLGLSNIDVDDVIEVRNSVIQVSVGFLF